VLAQRQALIRANNVEHSTNKTKHARASLGCLAKEAKQFGFAVLIHVKKTWMRYWREIREQTP
jgi:hypothetical protein